MGKKNKNKMKSQSAESVEKTDTEKDTKALSEQNLDDFMDNWDEDSDDETQEEPQPVKKKEKKKKAVVEKAEDTKKKKDSKSKDKKKKTVKKEPSPEQNEEEEERDSPSEDEDEEENPDQKGKTGAGNQKKYISSLKNQDPEFYEFLKENDEELLNFDESDSDEEDQEKAEGAHELPDKLDVASDESDFEDDSEDKPKKSNKKLTQAQVETIIDALNKQPTMGTINDVIEAFRAAVKSIAAEEKVEEEGTPTPPKYIVEGGAMFNSVVRMCVAYLQPALKSVLKLDSESNSKPEKSKKWKKVEKQVRIYLVELVTLLARVSEASVFNVLLKHVHSMLPYYQAYQKGAKMLMTRLVTIWSSSGSETPRILAFMCLVKLARNAGLLEPCVKSMYLSYVKNCKFTSPTTLPNISFMKRSLVEMFGLDHNLAYYQAFVYIRQLAIHLRNAITTNKKDAVQAVYNWQFIHSLELWGSLVGHCGHSETIKPLIYPLVQVIIGTAKLVPVGKFFPLRFHCAKILREISASTGTFIPVLPFYLDVLNTHNFKKKSKKVSMKPIDFSCILKLSKSQLLENGFKDSTIEEIYGGMLSYLADNSNKIAFPELITPMIFQLKDFLKKCKVQNYSKKIKTLLDKSVANQKMIEQRRKHVNFGVGETQKIQVWEAQVANDGTPLLSFYKNWKKTDDLKQAKKASEQEKLDDYSHIPKLKKKKLEMKEKSEPEVSGFLSGSDDDFDDEENFKLKEERGKKRKGSDSEESDEEEVESPKKVAKKEKKKAPVVVEEEEESDGDEEGEDDEVEDLKLDDLESDDEELGDDFGADASDDDNEQSDSSDDEEDDDSS